MRYIHSMLRRWRATAAVLTAASAVAACELFVDTGGLSSSDTNDAGATPDAPGTASDAIAEAGPGVDGGSDADASATDSGSDAGGCPGKAGPVMVSVGS